MECQVNYTGSNRIKALLLKRILLAIVWQWKSIKTLIVLIKWSLKLRLGPKTASQEVFLEDKHWGKQAIGCKLQKPTVNNDFWLTFEILKDCWWT